ncbi:IS66 family insertion sequence element accessory protein TnpB [Pseudomonas syringae]|uniref:IS66 family insertion sequence element accessory protein TnpB n=1 Tax=Pseudomonas syringae TaxID=317 RepID=UPI003F75A622
MKEYLYLKLVDFRKSIGSLATLVELDIKDGVVGTVVFIFLNNPHNRVDAVYWERNGFCLLLKFLGPERFEIFPDATD